MSEVNSLKKRGLSETSYILQKQNTQTTREDEGGTCTRENESNNVLENEISNNTTPMTPPPHNDMTQLVQEMDLGNDPAKSTMAHTSFNYINSILGSGIIGMPYALQEAGFWSGLILMIFVAFVTDYSLVLMVRGGELSGSYSYQGMMEAAFGRPGFYVLSVLQLVYPVIAMMSYNIIVGDTMTKVVMYLATSKIPESMDVPRAGVVLIATVFVTLPLSSYRDVARMSRVSFISLLSIGFIMIAISIRLGTFPIPPTPDAWKFLNTIPGAVQAIGVYAFAFMCHHNSFMLFNSIENKTAPKWNKVTHISVIGSLVVGLVFSIVGYTNFTGLVQGDLLENYCRDDTLMNISRVLFCLTMLLTYPLECFVARDVIENLFFRSKQPSPTYRHFCITLLIVLFAYIVSMSTDCLGITLELNGVLAAIPLAYILPSLCYIRLEPSRLFSRTKIPAILTALFGIIVSTSGLIFQVFLGSDSNKCSHGKEMPYCLTNSSILSNYTPTIFSPTIFNHSSS